MEKGRLSGSSDLGHLISITPIKSCNMDLLRLACYALQPVTANSCTFSLPPLQPMIFRPRRPLHCPIPSHPIPSHLVSSRPLISFHTLNAFHRNPTPFFCVFQISSDRIPGGYPPPAPPSPAPGQPPNAPRPAAFKSGAVASRSYPMPMLHSMSSSVCHPPNVPAEVEVGWLCGERA